MKIAIDIKETAHKKAGKSVYTFNIVKNLLDIDQENEYILYSDKEITDFDEYENARVEIVNKMGFAWHWTVLNNVYFEEADVYFSPTSYIIPTIHNPKKLKIVMTVHDLVAILFPLFHNKKAVFIEKLTLKRALKKVQHIVPVSQNTKKDLIERFDVPEDKMTVIYNSASDKFKDLGMERKKFIFAAGTLEPRKNFIRIIKAFVKLHARFPEYKLKIAGKKGWYFEEIFDTVKQLEAKEFIEFLGYVNDEQLVNLYNKATLFCYPSKYEGFGIPVLEAMKCGCPVVTSNVSSLPEVAGHSALLVNPKDEEEIYQAMRKLIEDENLRDQFSARGLKHAEKFSWKQSAEKLLEVFKKLD